MKPLQPVAAGGAVVLKVVCVCVCVFSSTPCESAGSFLTLTSFKPPSMLAVETSNELTVEHRGATLLVFTVRWARCSTSVSLHFRLHQQPVSSAAAAPTFTSVSSLFQTCSLCTESRSLCSTQLRQVSWGTKQTRGFGSFLRPGPVLQLNVASEADAHVCCWNVVV